MLKILLFLLAFASAAQAEDFYKGHPDNIPDWTARYFSPHEFASRGSGEVYISVELVAALDRVRAAVGHPIRITSGYRDAAWNVHVGGAPLSKHVEGIAVDINLHGLNDAQRYRLMWHLLDNGFTSYGSYRSTPSMLHADRRPSARIWRHGGGTYPDWFRAALADWGWQRTIGVTRKPVYPRR